MSDLDDPLCGQTQSSQQQQQQHQQPPTQTTPRSSLGSGALSYSNSSISPSTSSSSSGSAKSAVSECLGAWLNYLQIMNNLCAAGYRLAQTIAALEPWAYFEHPSTTTGGGAGQSGSGASNPSGIPSPSQSAQQQPGPQIPQLPFTTSQIPSHMAFQFITAWDELARASVMATSTVKSHIVSVLQDFKTQPLATVEQDSELLHIKEYNQLILQDNAQTMINLQHQFCVASCDAFAQLMCCYQCQTQVGFPHDPDCPMVQHPMSAAATIARTGGGGADQRSQTPSPHFGMKMQENARLYDRTGSISTQGSSSDHGTTAYEQTRGPSPHDIRGPSPIQGYLDNIRGPLPNPGHLSGMKAPFYRGSRSPLNFPLFTLNGQRRWSEAAAGEVNSEAALDPESQMRRWSMPWEAKADKSTVHWNQTRLMPISKLAVPASGPGPTPKSSLGDRSQSTTPDSTWHSSITSQDGLVEAIQLLSCRPIHRMQPMMMMAPPNIGPPFVEEPSGMQQESHNVSGNPPGLYGIWTQQNPPSAMLRQSTVATMQQDRMVPLMNYIREQDSSIDENPPN
ncbi:uncharacterized protein LOC120900551 isoform X2 [Anopheles arabiensis]|uniref:uncharacterized protein LOC120900551 isoform X2 n=1 Tax=Anopheles arabiensis TaxID=7173 RepID=UPI001AACE9D8|nr:uncharacterized protein LOC120900551 isoform X2 [Anopheles arabiensis]